MCFMGQLKKDATKTKTQIDQLSRFTVQQSWAISFYRYFSLLLCTPKALRNNEHRPIAGIHFVVCFWNGSIQSSKSKVNQFSLCLESLFMLALRS